MNDEEKALRDAWLAEMWPVCREVSREERAVAKVRRGLGTAALTWENGATTKAGRAGVDAPELPALTPEQARAPINDAASASACQQVAAW